MSSILLSSLPAGVLTDANGNALNNRTVFVYLRDTTQQVQVFSDEGLTVPVIQPLVTGPQQGAPPGGVPGYVAGGQSIDVVDSLTGARTEAEAISARDVLQSSTAFVTQKVVSLGPMGATQTVDFKSSINESLMVTGTLTADCTLSLVNTIGGCAATLLITQDSNGGHALTISGGAQPNQSVPVLTAPGSQTSVEIECPTASTVWVSVFGAQGPQGVQGVQGATGPTGLTGAQGITGAPGVGASWQGVWNSGTTYTVGQGVYRNGLPYISNTNGNLNHDPATDNGTNWGTLALTSLLDSATPSYNVKTFGAKGDGVYVLGSMVSGSITFTRATGSFTSADVGKSILVEGAGSGGVLLGTLEAAVGPGAPSGERITLNAALSANLPGCVVSLVNGSTQEYLSIAQPASAGSTVLYTTHNNDSLNHAYPIGTQVWTYPDGLSTTITAQAGTTATLNAAALATVLSATSFYGTDDTAAIQAAVDSIGNATPWYRGRVIFPDGYYCVAGPLKTAATSGNQITRPYRSQIALPDHGSGEAQMCVISFEGGVHPGGCVPRAGLTYGGPGPMRGAVLQSTLVGLSSSNITDFPSMVGGPVNNYSPLGWAITQTNVHFDTKNMVYRCPRNPSVTALNLQDVPSVNLHNVTFDTTYPPGSYDIGFQGPRPTHPSGHAIVWPMNNDMVGEGNFLEVDGYYCGMAIGEHILLNNVYIMDTIMCLSVWPSYHCNHATHLETDHSQYLIGFVDPSQGVAPMWTGYSNPQLTIDSWDIECYGIVGAPYNNGSSWIDLVEPIHDPNNVFVANLNLNVDATPVTDMFQPIGTGTTGYTGGKLVQYRRRGAEQPTQARLTTNTAHTVASAPTYSFIAVPWDRDQILSTDSDFHDYGSTSGLQVHHARIYDFGAMWDSSNPNQLTLPLPGLWLFELYICFESNTTGTYRYAQFGYNDVGAQYTGPSPNAYVKSTDLTHGPVPLHLTTTVRICGGRVAGQTNGSTVQVEVAHDASTSLQWNYQAADSRTPEGNVPFFSATRLTA